MVNRFALDKGNRLSLNQTVADSYREGSIAQRISMTPNKNIYVGNFKAIESNYLYNSIRHNKTYLYIIIE